MRNITRKITQTITGKTRLSGHKRLTGLTLRGLERCGYPFAYDSLSTPNTGSNVVTFYQGAVKEQIALKRSGRIHRLVIAPCSLTTKSSDPLFKYVVQHRKYVDLILVHTEWAKFRISEEAPELEALVSTWPIGVDLQEWSPPITRTNRQVLVYQKNAPSEVLDSVLQTVKAANLEPVLLNYGSYNIDEFHNALSQCFLAIFLSRVETQGMAMNECWAMDVPTIIWTDSSSLFEQFQHSAPLLTVNTGRFFAELDQLKSLLADLSWIKACTPKLWVEENLSLEKSIHQLVQLVNG
ncbi:MAG: glycosyltransferase [Planctomycetaceae bacterium]|nr:glycosyltransferase [Planctomycetaceae bacterium]